MPYGKNTHAHAAHKPTRLPKLFRATRKIGIQANALTMQSKT